LAERWKDSETDDIDMYYDEEDADGNKFVQLPSLKDPKMFRVRCRIGEEKTACICLMNKFFIEKGTEREVNIFSASALDKFPGCIFVEAHRDFHVKDAIRGLKPLSMNSIDIIAVKEITQIFAPDPSRNVNLQVGAFVRVKRGLYDSDLAIIENFDESLKKITVKIVPRLLSGTAYEDGLDDGKENEGGATKKQNYFAKLRALQKKNLRPPQKLFNPDEFDNPKCLDRNSNLYDYNKKKYQNGLLLMNIRISNLTIENVVPTFEEVQTFQKAELRKENRDYLMKLAMETIEESKKFLKNLDKGDKVKIISGDLKGLYGHVIEVNDNAVRVQPNVEMYNFDNIDFLPSEIVKVFMLGDHIEILAGKYKGLTGSVIKVDENIAFIISEDNKEEMQVLVNDIKYTSNVVTKVNTNQNNASTHEYNKHDLIMLNDNKTVGVIISVLRDTIVIYDTEGFCQTVNKVQVLNKLNPKGRIKNSYGQEIYPRCTIRVSDGIHKGQLALVKHVYSNFLFLFNEAYQENSGVWVEHINNCYFIGADMYDNTTRLARFNNPVLQKIQDEQNAQQTFGDDSKPKNIDKKSRQDPKSKKVNLIGQTRTVVRGPWKGYDGEIISLNNTTARFRLSAKPKTLSIRLEDLNIEPTEREGFTSSMKTGMTPMNHRPANSPFCIHTPAYNPD